MRASSPGPTREPDLSTRTGRAVVAGVVLSLSLPAVVAVSAAIGSPLLASSPAVLVPGPALEGRPVSVSGRVEVAPALAERARARPASRVAVRHAVVKSNRAAVKSNRVVVKSNVSAAARRRSVVVRFARSKVGARYGTSRGRYDCSKLTQAAYRAAGVRLPRTSGAQAARAYRVSWASARPGDLIVGRGHVGIYMGKRHGRQMMIDAGNRRVGVSYRAVYYNSQGLHPERVR